MGIESVQRLTKLLTPQQIAQVIGNNFRPSPSYDSPVITSSTTPSNMISCSNSMNIITTKDGEKDSGATNKASLLSTTPSSSSLRILSFGDEKEAIEYEIDEMEILNTQSAPKSYCEPSSFNVSRKKNNKPPSSSCSKDHVLAERKRREKLSKLFIDLSTTIPYQKKNDKESLLGNTVEYIKDLQSKVKALEQDIEIPTELAFLVDKRPLLMDMDSMFSNESSSTSQQPLKIEAKLNGKTVMLNIQCENHKGVVVKAMLEIEKLPITITNTSIMPFGDDSSLDMVIMAQVEDGASVIVRDLVENLSSTFKQILWET